MLVGAHLRRRFDMTRGWGYGFLFDLVAFFFLGLAPCMRVMLLNWCFKIKH